ncbi:MAG: hypothetical protein ACREC6_02810, partial [Hyphomicrobiaceae bacterium]
PEVAVSRRVPDIVVRPLRPPLLRTLALIERRNKPSEAAFAIVREALLALRRDEDIEPVQAMPKHPRRSQGAAKRKSFFNAKSRD